MKVSELIAQLQACDPDSTVVTYSCCEGYDFEPKATTKRLYWPPGTPQYRDAHEYEGWVVADAEAGKDMSWLFGDEPITIQSVVVVD